jgi:hypothetical protein
MVAERILGEVRQCSESEERQGEDVNSFIKTSVVHATFLCSILCQDSSRHHLAFKIGLHGLQVLRKPAKSKALEVGRAEVLEEYHHLKWN